MLTAKLYHFDVMYCPLFNEVLLIPSPSNDRGVHLSDFKNNYLQNASISGKSHSFEKQRLMTCKM
jgi:hypothetical protein